MAAEQGKSGRTHSDAGTKSQRKEHGSVGQHHLWGGWSHLIPGEWAHFIPGEWAHLFPEEDVLISALAGMVFLCH